MWVHRKRFHGKIFFSVISFLCVDAKGGVLLSCADEIDKGKRKSLEDTENARAEQATVKRAYQWILSGFLQPDIINICIGGYVLQSAPMVQSKVGICVVIS